MKKCSYWQDSFRISLDFQYCRSGICGLGFFLLWQCFFCHICAEYLKRTYGQAGVAAGVVFPYILFALVKLLPNYETSYVLRDLDQCFLYFPCIVVGDLLAGYQVFEKADQRIHCRMFLAASENCQKEF